MSDFTEPGTSGLKKAFSRRWLLNAAIGGVVISVFWMLLPHLLNEPVVRGLRQFNDGTRLTFTALRWSFYLAAIGFGPALITRKRSTAMAPEDKKSLRWMMVRVFVVYDLIFAFDLFGWRS